jgi:DNA-directed RNA polymerase subunit RPC12/RpoP
MSHKCRECGIKLNKDNKYPGKRGKICKQCDNLLRIKRRYPSGQTYSVLLGKNKKYPNFSICSVNSRKISTLKNVIYATFETSEEIGTFRMMRRVQKRFGRCHDSSSSRDGCRVESLNIEEKMVEEKKIVHKYYIASKCMECGNEVNYNKHGEQQCTSCGLIQGNYNLLTSEPEYNSHDDAIGYSSSNYVTYDKYYSKAYGGRKTKNFLQDSQDSENDE